MSACKTGCGTPQVVGWVLCVEHERAWLASPEYAAYMKNTRGVWWDVGSRALEDFCNRMRAERQNGVSRAD